MGYFVIFLIVLFLQQCSLERVILVLWPTMLGLIAVVIALFWHMRD